MNEKYVLDVERNHEGLTHDILSQFAIEEKINIDSCEHYIYKGRFISSFYVTCSMDTFENLKTILKNRGVKLL